MHVLGLDVGTSSVKAGVLDVESAALVGPVERVPYDLQHPSPDGAEVPVPALWAAIRRAVIGALGSGTHAEGIGVSCFTPGLVLLDAHAEPLAPVWTHLDRRSRSIARQVWQEVGEEFLLSTGNRPLPGGTSVISYRQLLAQQPELRSRIRSYLHVNGWLAMHLTGQRAFDPANASFTGLYDTLTGAGWSDRWCAYFQVEPEWLAPIVDGRTTVGGLRGGAAAELGLREGLPVRLGTADTSCAMLAAEMQAGDLLHVVGTTQVLAAFANPPRPSPERLTRRFGVGDSLIHVTHNPVGGAALEWLHQLCFHDLAAPEFYNQTMQEALRHATEVRLEPAELGGDRLELGARSAGFHNLRLTTTRLDLLAAVLEALKRGHQEALQSLGMGNDWRRVFLSGGGAGVVRQLGLYPELIVQPLHAGSLRGVAPLFRTAL